MHPLYGMYRCVPRGSALAKVPVEANHQYGSVRFGAGGGSRTHFSHPFHGCLLRVATRCVCSPSPEPIGLRWTSQPRPRAPGNLDRAGRNRISLLKIGDAFRDYARISFHTSLATCTAASSVRTFPINSLPVLKTDTL